MNKVQQTQAYGKTQAYVFCIKKREGNLMYTEAQTVEITTNIKVEVSAILKAISYYPNQNWMQIQLETNSLSTKRMIMGQWRIPCTLKEIIEKLEF